MKISHVSKGVILNPSVVTLNASYVILNEVKNLSAGSVKSLRVNSVKDLRWLRDSSPEPALSTEVEILRSRSG